jgi:Flp pilus assembly protein TadD
MSPADLAHFPVPPAALPGGRLRARARWCLGALAGPRVLPWLLAGITFATFLPALWNGFVEWDDYVNLIENQRYRGLGWPQLRWMATTTLMGHYIPVTWLTFGLDYSLWGMNPLGYHLTNNALHALNAAVFYLVALRLLRAASGATGALLRLSAATATLFFALHPLRAESVAWATERRDVLSGLFFLLTILLYLRAAQAPDGARRRGVLAASAACFALGLLSKSIIMTLPALLLILDVYPLGRLPWQPWRWSQRAARPVLLEKAPFFAVGLAGAAVSYWAVAHNDFITPLAKYPWSGRIGMTFYSYWFYLWKTAWPGGLSPLYELPQVVDPLAPRFLGTALGVAAVSALALALAIRFRWPAGLAAWIYYLVFLGPVTGIVHSGHQLAHDRYSYLACLGFALLVGGAVSAMADPRLARAVRPGLAQLATGATTVWVLALGLLTWYQVQVWRDTDTLWRFALESDAECSVCHSNLGAQLLKQYAYGPARKHFERALELRPDRHRTRSNYGLALSRLGETERALEELHTAVAYHPTDADALSNLGGILISEKRLPEALAYLERAVAAKPDHAIARANLGSALTEAGRPTAGVPHLERAAQINPDEALIWLLLGRARLAAGDFRGAERAYETLAKLNNPSARRLADGLAWL